MITCSLKNHGVDDEVDLMFEMGAETMKLPLDEKMKFEQGDEGMSFGQACSRAIYNRHPNTDLRIHRYKALGANATDETGSLDNVEFINIAKDDVLAWPRRVRRDYPATVYSRMESTIIPFVRKSLAINQTFLDVFNARLGLPEGALTRRHSMEEYSGSEARCIKSPPKSETASPTAIGAHSDFGSLVRRVESSVVSPPCSSWA